MLNEIKSLYSKIDAKLKDINSADKLEQFRLEYLVKKGEVQALFDRMKALPPTEKPLVGKELNVLRTFAETHFNALKEKFEHTASAAPSIDITLPGRTLAVGSEHPVVQTMNDMIDVFTSMGFAIAEGPGPFCRDLPVRPWPFSGST